MNGEEGNRITRERKTTLTPEKEGRPSLSESWRGRLRLQGEEEVFLHANVGNGINREEGNGGAGAAEPAKARAVRPLLKNNRSISIPVSISIYILGVYIYTLLTDIITHTHTSEGRSLLLLH